MILVEACGMHSPRCLPQSVASSPLPLKTGWGLSWNANLRKAVGPHMTHKCQQSVCSEDMPARAQAALRSMDRKRRHPQCLRHTCAGGIRTDAKQAPARPAACRPAGRLRGACWPVGAKLPPLSRLTQCSTSSLFAHVWFKHSCPAVKLAASGHAAPLRAPLCWPPARIWPVSRGRAAGRGQLSCLRRPPPVAPPSASRAARCLMVALGPRRARDWAPRLARAPPPPSPHKTP